MADQNAATGTTSAQSFFRILVFACSIPDPNAMTGTMDHSVKERLEVVQNTLPSSRL